MPIKRDFEVGDVVVIRDWDDMEDEFGPTDSAGDLPVGDHCYFTSGMRYLCGKEGIITGLDYNSIDDACRVDLNIDVDIWNISPGMLRRVDEGSHEVDRASFMDFLSGH